MVFGYEGPSPPPALPGRRPGVLCHISRSPDTFRTNRVRDGWRSSPSTLFRSTFPQGHSWRHIAQRRSQEVGPTEASATTTASMWLEFDTSSREYQRWTTNFTIYEVSHRGPTRFLVALQCNKEIAGSQPPLIPAQLQLLPGDQSLPTKLGAGVI